MQPRWFTQNIRYDPRLGYVMLQLPLVDLPPRLVGEGTEFEAKTELHCSLLCIQKLAENFSDPTTADSELTLFVEEYTKNNDISFGRFTDHAYICEYEGAKSIIAGAKVKGIEELFNALRGSFPELRVLPTPALHVTLYKYNHKYGIGIQNQAQLRELCRPLPPDTLPQIVKEKLL